MRDFFIFNELSLEPLAKDIREVEDRFKEILKVADGGTSFGFKNIRIETGFHEKKLMKDMNVREFLNQTKQKDLKSLVFKKFVPPFVRENSPEEEIYLENKFFIQKDCNDVQCHGLAVAFIEKTLSISLASSDFWKSHRYELKEVENTVYHVSIIEHWKKPEVKLYLLRQGWDYNIIFNRINFEKRSLDDIKKIKKDRTSEEKLFEILIGINDLCNTGKILLDGFKCEQLKGDKRISVRLDNKNRIVYSIERDESISLKQCLGHYDDK